MTISELSRSRPAAESSSKPRVRATIRNLITRVRLWLSKLVSFAFARVLMIFLVGFAAGIAWQSYGDAARKTIASVLALTEDSQIGRRVRVCAYEDAGMHLAVS